MASGRLGSALVGANRTLTVYDNTSGYSAAISLLAKIKSTTSNGALSVILDSSSTAPETTSQISSTSFNKEVLKLFYNSTTPASVSSVTAKFEYSTYSNSNREVKLTELPSNTVTNSNTPSCFINPLWMTSNWADWGVGTSPSNGLIGVTTGDTSGTVRYVTQAQIDSAGLGWTKYQINSSQTSPSYTYQGATSNSYGAYYGSIDIYCNLQPYWTTTSNAYMGVVYLNTSGSQASNHTRSSNSLMYSYITNSNPGSNSGVNKESIWASGGIVIFANKASQTMYIVCYGRNVTSNTRIEQVIEQGVASTGAGYPYHYQIQNGNTKNSTGFYSVNFFEHNPNTQKSYALMIWDGKRRLLEFDVVAWEAALAADDGTTGNAAQSLDSTISRGLVTDVSSTAPSFFLDDGVTLGGPIVRTAKSKWIVPLRSGSTYNIYETDDLKTYTLYNTTSNYTESLDDDTIVVSDGTDTDKITSNLSSLDQGGLIEHQTSFNDYERTGLVLSNNDRVIVRNHGTEDFAFNVMGYEETS